MSEAGMDVVRPVGSCLGVAWRGTARRSTTDKPGAEPKPPPPPEPEPKEGDKS